MDIEGDNDQIGKSSKHSLDHKHITDGEQQVVVHGCYR